MIDKRLSDGSFVVFGSSIWGRHRTMRFWNFRIIELILQKTKIESEQKIYRQTDLIKLINNKLRHSKTT